MLYEVITNMVYWRLEGTQGDRLAEALAQRGVRMLHVGNGWLRAVTHLEITDAGVARTLEAVRAIANES